MSTMPRPRRPYLQKEITRHGKTVWYFRRGKEKRIRLSGAYGSAEFVAAYDAAASGGVVEKTTRAPKSSLRWLVDRYYESGRFGKLAANTQRNYRLALEKICKTGGNLSFRAITTGDVRAGKTRREAKPSNAIIYVQVMRTVFEFAIDSNWMEKNPADGVTAEQPKSDGYHTWTIEEVMQFRERHAIGTQARLAMELLLFTGLRVSDAIVLGPQHVKNGIVDTRAMKNGAEITIPLHTTLAACIEATKRNNLVYLENTWGRPWKVVSFCQWFEKRCIEAGVEGRAHGLRKAGATFAADNDATTQQLMAMYGWTSPKMAEGYTKKRNRVRLAERAANKLFPHLENSKGIEDE